MKRITISLPDHVLEQLNDEADNVDISTAKRIRDLIDRGLDAETDISLHNRMINGQAAKLTNEFIVNNKPTWTRGEGDDKRCLTGAEIYSVYYPVVRESLTRGRKDL